MTEASIARRPPRHMAPYRLAVLRAIEEEERRGIALLANRGRQPKGTGPTSRKQTPRVME